ncbi:MAG: hypothetical protein K8W52_39810 [Deltaproteobacteria bacterium]|nr:hypothetical protein [Deltaproteobacteria bacterium]
MRIHLEAILLGTLLAAACSHPAPQQCTDGAAGCACRVDNTCDDGLACDLTAHTCEATHDLELPAIDPAARSCELLLEDATAQVVRATFAASVEGESIRQAPRTGVTFYAAGDHAIAHDAVHIQLTGTGGMTVARARCFDRDGHAIPGGGIATGG